MDQRRLAEGAERRGVEHRGVGGLCVRRPGVIATACVEAEATAGTQEQQQQNGQSSR